jgi:hypothetical protein
MLGVKIPQGKGRMEALAEGCQNSPSFCFLNHLVIAAKAAIHLMAVQFATPSDGFPPSRE